MEKQELSSYISTLRASANHIRHYKWLALNSRRNASKFCKFVVFEGKFIKMSLGGGGGKGKGCGEGGTVRGI
jgi:hypothetical protein